MTTGVETPMARGPESGQLVYAPNGRLSVQIVRPGRDAEAGSSADGFSSYFGWWKLVPASGHILHIKDGDLNQARVGEDAPRSYAFDTAGRLSLATPARLRDDGREISSVFIWEKIP
ncbi:MAG: lipocalin-like domain-containing protein [Candidatus Synoicihabitans palmerolidicus]|nr:lipocalin-like domain-containing protein [Candidatus Synoicihabitans palmerolidicus]